LAEPRPLLGVSAQMMRRVLVDSRVGARLERRGRAAVVHVPLDRIDVACNEPDAELVAVDDALTGWRRTIRGRRGSSGCDSSGVVDGRDGPALGVSPRTARNDWAFARAGSVLSSRK
jgi:hypothetical protein